LRKSLRQSCKCGTGFDQSPPTKLDLPRVEEAVVGEAVLRPTVGDRGPGGDGRLLLAPSLEALCEQVVRSDQGVTFRAVLRSPPKAWNRLSVLSFLVPGPSKFKLSPASAVRIGAVEALEAVFFVFQEFNDG